MDRVSGGVLVQGGVERPCPRCASGTSHRGLTAMLPEVRMERQRLLQRKLRKERHRLGLCPCGGDKGSDYRTCKVCRARDRQRLRTGAEKYRKTGLPRRKLLQYWGLCTECKQPRSKSTWYCDTCLKWRRNWLRQWRHHNSSSTESSYSSDKAS